MVLLMIESAMPATDDDTLLPFALPSICQKKVTAAFDGGRISSVRPVSQWYPQPVGSARCPPNKSFRLDSGKI
jgi:hypothetical protein